MKALIPGLVLCLLASSAAAQQNPFKLPKNKTSVAVDYSYAGDMQGTGERAISNDRVMERRSTTGKFFGKTSTMDTWTLVTPDSSYSADLTRRPAPRDPTCCPTWRRPTTIWTGPPSSGCIRTCRTWCS